MKDYWAKCGAMFQGQKTQYFLLFVAQAAFSNPRMILKPGFVSNTG